MTKREIIKWFTFCFAQAKENFGLYITSPYENSYREDLINSKKALQELKKLFRKRRLKKKRRAVIIYNLKKRGT